MTFFQTRSSATIIWCLSCHVNPSWLRRYFTAKYCLLRRLKRVFNTTLPYWNPNAVLKAVIMWIHALFLKVRFNLFPFCTCSSISWIKCSSIVSDQSIFLESSLVGILSSNIFTRDATQKNKRRNQNWKIVSNSCDWEHYTFVLKVNIKAWKAVSSVSNRMPKYNAQFIVVRHNFCSIRFHFRVGLHTQQRIQVYNVQS